jgi:hypothetical protein
VNTQEALRSDPLRRNVDLSLSGTFYPAGFRLDIATNSPDVLAAAGEAWELGRCAFAAAPMVLRVLVQPEGGLAPVPVHRMQGHLYSAVSDCHNFAHLDLKSDFGFLQVSERTAADHSWLRWFFIESMAYVMLAQRSVVPVHSACVARNGTGIMLSGQSGAGKSTLSFACARAGWTFVTDDCTWLVPDSPERIAIGRPRHARFRLDAPHLFPELEGYAVRARPNGKIGIQVPLTDLPHIQTAPSAPIGGIVFLDRRSGEPGLQRLASAEAVERLLTDRGSYGEEVDALHERTIRQLSAAPAWRMRYETLEEAIALLETLPLETLGI